MRHLYILQLQGKGVSDLKAHLDYFYHHERSLRKFEFFWHAAAEKNQATSKTNYNEFSVIKKPIWMWIWIIQASF